MENPVMTQQLILPKLPLITPVDHLISGYDQPTLAKIRETTGYRLCSASQIENPAANLDALERKQMKATMDWVHQFIMRPHPKLGRAGVVCPYVKLSLDASIFYLSVANLENPRRYDEIFNIMNTHAEIFAKMEPKSGPLENLRVLMVLVPNGKDGVLSHAQHCKQLKTEMMERDITVGQFFPTWNPIKYLKSKFFPNQPPFCMYTMRAFIRSDWMFVNGEPEWRKVYLEKFGSPPDPKQGFTL
jgi:hypothetical protein